MSSEETVSIEGVKGRIEREEEDLGVPQNILERDNRRERSFDLEDEIVSEKEREGLLCYVGQLNARVCPLHGGWAIVPLFRVIGVGFDGVQFGANAARLECCANGDGFRSIQPGKKGGITLPSSNNKNRGLFNTRPSSIKGWKDKFFFMDDTRWDNTAAEVENLNRWKGKEVNPNKYSLTLGELEDVRVLERGDKDVLDIFAEMNNFLDATGGAGIPKKKRITVGVTTVGEGDDGSFALHPDDRSLPKEEIAEFVPPPPIEGEPPSQEAWAAPQGKGKGYVRLPTSSFYKAGMRSMAKRFINTYFMKVDHQRAQDEVALHKGKIYKYELEMEKELDKVRNVAIELELQVHNSTEVHIAEFLKSGTFNNIINLYQFPTEREVKENGASETIDFQPEIELKWDWDSQGQTVLPSNFDFKFVPVNDEENGDADKPD
ncbi:hypothetical protein SLEP1_g6584 [Rubroshorea leprosula]|uniref:Uncharacterized protein n=1 Tax=Rubroshorea leprosula TaxID=152421 RepID=A0AAV5I1N7_9ROSI|nr:hypothetical protein SLEP1_g6584 [Rubroshorea leprosula]